MAPDFSGVTTDGSKVRLKDFRGKKLVLYFYPMDDTPGCTAQACSLRDHNAEIRAKGAAILGVSAQGVESHQRFTTKYKLGLPAARRHRSRGARAYGTIGGGLGGTLRGMLGMAERVTVRHRRAGSHRARDRRREHEGPRRAGAGAALAPKLGVDERGHAPREQQAEVPDPGERHVLRAAASTLESCGATKLSWQL